MPTADRLRLTQLLSPAFPVGSFAHSQGLEQAISAGIVTNPAALEDWIRAILTHGAARLDATFLAAARGSTEAPDPDDSAILETLSAHYLALLPSPGREREARELGQGFTTLAAALGTPLPPGLPLPVAIGAATRGLQAGTGEVLALWLHGLAAQLVSVAVRFMPMGQAAGQQVLARLAPLIAALAAEAAETPPEQAWSFTPGADLASIRQDQMETRIFRS